MGPLCKRSQNLRASFLTFQTFSISSLVSQCNWWVGLAPYLGARISRMLEEWALLTWQVNIQPPLQPHSNSHQPYSSKGMISARSSTIRIFFRKDLVHIFLLRYQPVKDRSPSLIWALTAHRTENPNVDRCDHVLIPRDPLACWSQGSTLPWSINTKFKDDPVCPTGPDSKEGGVRVSITYANTNLSCYGPNI